MLQRTDDWYKARLGKATASRFDAIMSGERYAGWRKYKAELLVERITGRPTETFQSKEMLWGIDTEPLARLRYLLVTKNKVEECGFFEHPELAAGASPDSLIGEDGGLEIKCPNTATHIETLKTGKVPKIYIAQVQGGMWITGRKWWDYVSFDPRLPDNAAMYIVRVPRDDVYIDLLDNKVRSFLKELDEEVEFVNKYERH